MSRVLLTGATGFVGRHAVSPLVADGFEVHAVARKVPAEADERVLWHEGDLLDPAETDAIVRGVGASHLLHLAWYAEHGKYWQAAENLDWVAATLRLVRSFHAAGGERIVAAGTCAEYEWDGDCCDEQTPLRPGTLYGSAKDATRRILEAYAAAAGLSFAWGRVFFLYGPGEQPGRVVASVARAALAGEPIACTSGEQVRDFLYVEDVASAFAALLSSEGSGCFDIGSGERTPLKDVLLGLERLAGREDIVRLGQAPERDEPAVIVADPRRIRDEIGWQPAHDLRAGLALTLDWWHSTGVDGRREGP